MSLLKGLYISALIICAGILIHANTLAQDYRMNYDKGKLSLSAQKADIKTLLSGIARETNIFIQFPKALKKKITIELSDVPIRNALRRLLKGQDYAIVYAASKDNNSNSISEVYVLPQQWGKRKPARSPTEMRRQERIIRNFKRRLDSLRNRLTKVDRGSRAEEVISAQIRSIERTVERLENR